MWKSFIALHFVNSMMRIMEIELTTLLVGTHIIIITHLFIVEAFHVALNCENWFVILNILQSFTGSYFNWTCCVIFSLNLRQNCDFHILHPVLFCNKSRIAFYWFSRFRYGHFGPCRDSYRYIWKETHFKVISK